MPQPTSIPRLLTTNEWQKLRPLTDGVFPRSAISVVGGNDQPQAAAWVNDDPVIHYNEQYTTPTTDRQTAVRSIPDRSGQANLPILAHEAAHIVDPQATGTLPGLTANYSYGGPTEMTKRYQQGKDIFSWGTEQRAELIKDYFFALQNSAQEKKYHIKLNSSYSAALPIYAHYMQQLKNAQIQKQEQDKFRDTHPETLLRPDIGVK